MIKLIEIRKDRSLFFRIKAKKIITAIAASPFNSENKGEEDNTPVVLNRKTLEITP